MPSLNQAQFLELSIRSVLEQDYQNVELIVIDGLSSDGSVDLLIKLQAEYSERLRWVSQKDSGAAEAINHAISLANGDLIGWLNSDDVYLQGALSRAVACFRKYPAFQMVYGKGAHIDSIGLDLGLYPTRPPSTPLNAFADGSFICQPTVFMRRDALLAVGPLDLSIRTAFDFDLFIRFFKRFPGQIGMVNKLQALSRLHPACMTQKLRNQVAIDGMHVVAKEFGEVPTHWFWTHVEEIFEKHPFDMEKLAPARRIEAFLKEAAAYFSSEALDGISKKLLLDQRLHLATPELFATVQPDGWVENYVVIKYQLDGTSSKAVLVECETAWPIESKLRLKITCSDGQQQYVSLHVPEDFILRLEVPKSIKSGCITWSIEASDFFVPAKYDKYSVDERRLSFRVLKLDIDL